MKLTDITEDTVIVCDSPAERKQALDILDSTEVDQLGANCSYNVAPNILYRKRHQEYKTIDNTHSCGVKIPASTFIQNNS